MANGLEIERLDQPISRAPGQKAPEVTRTRATQAFTRQRGAVQPALAQASQPVIGARLRRGELSSPRNRALIKRAAGVPAVDDKRIEGAQAISIGAERRGVSPAEVNPRDAKEEATGKAVTDSDEELENQQKIALVIAALAPVLAGAALGGLEGGAVGGQVGAQTVGQISTGFQQEAAREREIVEAEQIKETRRQELKLTATEQRKTQLAVVDARLQGQRELAEIKQEQLNQLRALGVKDAPKNTQFQAATFGRRMEQAESTFGQLERGGFDPTTATAATQRLGVFPEAVKSEEQKLQDQAERNFVNSVLRRESGAAISESEFDSAEAQYFPRIGDTPAVLNQKKINRLIAINALKAEAGPAWERVPSVFILSGGVPPPNPPRGFQQVTVDGLGPPSAIAGQPQFDQLSDQQLDQLLIQQGIDPNTGVPVQR